MPKGKNKEKWLVSTIKGSGAWRSLSPRNHRITFPDSGQNKGGKR